MRKRLGLRHYAGLTGFVATAAVFTLMLAGGAGAVAGAAFTTIGPDPYNNCFSGPGLVNCNLYSSKTDVWINGGPAANGLSDGTYYFAVTDPSGAELLSTDSYSDRLLTISGGEIADSSATTHNTSGTSPDLIVQLSPYLDTPNNGGEYKAWICQAAIDPDTSQPILPVDGDPPSTNSLCKTDNFKVRNRDCDPADPECDPPSPFGVVSGQKYYDANHDGQRGPGETGIANWPIDFTDGLANTLFTDSDGNFSVNLPPDTYTFTEELANSPWTQTGEVNVGTQTEGQAQDTGDNSTTLSNFVYSTTVLDGGSTSDLLFGNVCTVGNTGGLTLGFWSNKNGQAILAAPLNSGWAAKISALNLVGPTSPKKTLPWIYRTFTSSQYSDFKTWILNATATNASYMLSAQLTATVLNVNYGNPAQSTSVLVKVVLETSPGVFTTTWEPLSQVITEATAFLAAHKDTTASGVDRDNALMYKNIFDGLNNNLLSVTPATSGGCPVATFAAS